MYVVQYSTVRVVLLYCSTVPREVLFTASYISATKTLTMLSGKPLPLCDIRICYDADLVLGDGFVCLQKNLLQGYVPSKQVEGGGGAAAAREGEGKTANAEAGAEKEGKDTSRDGGAGVSGPSAYVYYRRRSPSDRLVWSPKRLELGDLLDAKDEHGGWCFATVVDMDPRRGLRIHYTRWSDEHDEWIRVSETKRLSPYATRSKEETTITRGKLWRTTPETIQAKIDRFRDLSGAAAVAARARAGGGSGGSGGSGGWCSWYTR